MAYSCQTPGLTYREKMIIAASLKASGMNLAMTKVTLLLIAALSSMSCAMHPSRQQNTISDSVTSPAPGQAISKAPSSSLSSVFLAPSRDTSLSAAVELEKTSEGLSAQPDAGLLLSRSKRAISETLSTNSTQSTCSSRSPGTQVTGNTRSHLALAQINDLETASYSMEGDIVLGSFIWMYTSVNSSRCVPGISGTGALQTVEAMNYAVKTVNSDPSILPGVKLGFAQIPTCGVPNVALAQALSFLPRIKAGSSTCSHKGKYTEYVIMVVSGQSQMS
ncbi:metabotropic glutamate receptor [Elysia marginata]|uniref:Metabotropic glutamate receptor n=1 Tax=Elysia marginata TaxID=1093978 RepID=A0AAV4IXY7_9GAST|nr:metabotropic glutamate receptor [Elysia marginata]